MMIKRKIVKSGVAVLSSVFLLAGCGASTGNSGGGSQNVIKIGVPVPLSGSYASAGFDIVNAAKLAAKDINNQGGVLGKKIQIDAEDDQCDSQTGVQVAQKMVDNGVSAVAGGYCSSASIPESGVFNNSNIAFVADASTSPQLTEQGLKNVFRTIGRDDEQGPFAADFISQYLHAKTAAVIDDNTTYSKGLATSVIAGLKKNGVNVVYANSLTPGEQDYSAILTKVKYQNPDVVFYTGYFAEAGILVKEARALNIKATFMGGDATNDPTLIKTAGNAANGMFITTNPLPQFVKGADSFLQSYEKAYNTNAGPYSLYEYDAVQVIADAIKRANSTDSQKIIDALHQTDHFNGLTGPIAFNSVGDRTDPKYIIITIKDGKFEPFKELNKQGLWVDVK